MNSRSFSALWLQRLLHAAVLLSLLFSPLQSIAAHVPPPAPPAPVAPAIPSTGLYRTTVTLRTPADWTRLEGLGVVVLEERTAGGRTADQRKNTDQESAQSVFFRSSVAILAGEDQLEALARLCFEPRSTDELGALVMAHAQEKPWLVAGVRWLVAEIATDQQKGTDQEAAQSASFRSSAALTPELRAGLAALTSVDDDADDLTNPIRSTASGYRAGARPGRLSVGGCTAFIRPGFL
ncbi:MAG: hypothetical protein ACE5I2_10930 [Anaerolineae bacterium]